MRRAAFTILVGSLAAVAASVAGCRTVDRAPNGPDPRRPDTLAPCPPEHYAVLLRPSAWDEDPSLVRFDRDLVACQGAVFPDAPDPRAIGGLPSGEELVGFAESSRGPGRLVRVNGATSVEVASDEALFPISIAALDWQGTPAVVVLWGEGELGREEGERIDVYAADDLALLGRWNTTGFPQPTAVAPPISGQPARVAGALGGDLQEYRSDPGADTLATTDELLVARPDWSGLVRSLDVRGDRVAAGANEGVLRWQRGLPTAFLGPVSCRWPHFVGTPLPEDGADYGDVAIDVTDPEATLVLVSGTLEGTSGTVSLFYRQHRRGECELIYAVPDGYRAVALSRAGS